MKSSIEPYILNFMYKFWKYKIILKEFTRKVEQDSYFMFEVIGLLVRVLVSKKKDTQLYCIHFAFTLNPGVNHISRSDNHKEQYCVRIILSKRIRKLLRLLDRIVNVKTILPPATPSSSCSSKNRNVEEFNDLGPGSF